MFFFSRDLVKFHVVEPYNRNDTVKAWKYISFISSVISDFPCVANQSIAVYSLPINRTTSFSVDEIVLPRYGNWTDNFRGTPFNEMTLLWLKYTNSV